MTETLPTDTASIRCLDTDLASLQHSPCHFRCGIYLVCTQGRALVSTGVQRYEFDAETELIFLTGSLVQVLRASADFEARVLMFPKEVFLKAVLPIDKEKGWV